MKTQKHMAYWLLAIGTIALAACGPSPEEQATMTAAAWTPTPTITPSPTPLPIDLSVQVQDEEGNPIEGASVTLVDMDETVTTDAEGLAAWEAIPSNGVTLAAEGQGYFPAESEATLENGLNELVIALERDPYGLLASEACLEGEQIVVVEDFQDRIGQGFNAISLETKPAGLEVVSSPEEPEDLVMSIAPDAVQGGFGRDQVGAEQFIWRGWYRVGDTADIQFFFFATEERSYQVTLATTGRGHASPSRIQHNEGDANIPIAFEQTITAGEWHFVEIGFHSSVVDVWIDGEPFMSATDEAPLDPSGGMGVGRYVAESPQPSTFYIDDISICESPDGFQSAYQSPEEENSE